MTSFVPRALLAGIEGGVETPVVSRAPWLRPALACSSGALLGLLAAEAILVTSQGRASELSMAVALCATLLHVAGIVLAACDIVRQRSFRAGAPLLLTTATAVLATWLT